MEYSVLAGVRTYALRLNAEENNLPLSILQNSMITSGLSWEDLLHPLYQKYKNHITWGDQDLLNIIFHYNPGKKFFTSYDCFLCRLVYICVYCNIE